MISGLSSSIHEGGLFKDRKILQSSTPISSPRSTTVNNVPRASFDSDIVIILAALICSVVCALSVSAAARCRRRYRRSLEVFELEIEVGVEGAKSVTDKKFDIKALPTTVCGTGSALAGMDCPICLTEFVEGEKVRVLPGCYHSFHVNCIDKWVVSNPSCPSCRYSLHHVAAEEKSSGVFQPAADIAHENNESVLEDHVLQSSNSYVDDTTMAALSCLDCIRSNELERANVVDS